MIKNSQTDVITSLRKSLNWMELVLATLHEAVLIVSKDMSILYANESAYDLFDITQASGMNLYIWDALHLIKNDRPVNKKNFQKAQAKRNLQSLSGAYKFKKDNVIYDLDITVEAIPTSKELIFII